MVFEFKQEQLVGFQVGRLAELSYESGLHWRKLYV